MAHYKFFENRLIRHSISPVSIRTFTVPRRQPSFDFVTCTRSFRYHLCLFTIMMFSSLKHSLVCAISIVFFILVDPNLITENTVLGGKDELNSVKYCFNFKWGSDGTSNGQFLRPHDVNFDSKGNVYVSDRDRNDIQKFTPNGTFIMKWGSEGEKAGQFNVPYSIEIDRLDNIYVIDRGNQRMQVFSHC